ncbi:MAG: DUF87 domain-containing protein [Clostridia bacterium]|nr:DUF87 domain-containing protein [Clostridia bacterium]MBR0351420.1 DUF87 domain-containing protein [Clostridia bacterium]
MKQKEFQKMSNNTELLELITPQGIKVKNTSIQTGETLSKIFYVSGYPSSTNLGWLSAIQNIRAVEISIGVSPIDPQVFIEGISKGMNTDLNIINTTRNEAERTRAEMKVASGKRIIQEIESNSTSYTYVSFTAKINGKDEVDLERNVKHFKNRIAGMGFKIRTTPFLVKNAYMQTSPFAPLDDEITTMANKNMSLYTLMGGMPFSGSGFIDEKGYYLGTDETGRMIALDPFYSGEDRTNFSITILGTSGSGKSFATKKILLNEWMQGRLTKVEDRIEYIPEKVLIIDPENEYEDMCRALDGDWIDCSGGTGESVGRINPLQINPIPKDEEGEKITKSATSLHYYNLHTFFKLLFPEITSFHQAKLDVVLEELYKNFDIDWDTDINTKEPKDFPIMKDLYDLLLKKSKDSKTDEDDKKIYKELSSLIRSLAIGAEAELFNGYTTIEGKSNFIVLDVSNLQGADPKLKTAQYFNILRWCEEVVFRNRNERCVLACDEAHLLIDKKVPQALDFLKGLSKRARKYETSLIIITQSVVDFTAEGIKEYGQAILDNSTNKLFFGMDGKNLQQAKTIWNFNKEESHILSSLIKGQGLLQVGTARTLVRIKGLPFETKVFGNKGGR